MNHLTCALCNTALEKGMVTHPISVGDERVTVSVPGLVCRKCEESFVEADDIRFAEAKVALAIIDTGGASGPRFRFLRAFLGLTARDLGGTIKIAPETISRWEKGQRAVDPLAWLALSTLVRDRISGREDARRTLYALEHPQPLAKVLTA